MTARHILQAALVPVLVLSAAFAPVQGPPITHMIVLGDSVSDQGNLFEATGIVGAPLGLPPLPAADHYWNGRFSNGESYAGVLANLLGFELTPSLFGGTNFAFGGARTTYNTVEPPLGPYPAGAYPWSLNAQREAFEEQVHPRQADPTGLYVVFSGANDLADVLTRGLNPAATIATTVDGIRRAILAFRDAGARTVLVPNVPNLGVLPGVTALGPGAIAAATGLTVAYNASLDAMLDAVEEATGIRIIRFDTFAFITDVVSHPVNYGLTNVTQPCYSGYVVPNPAGVECGNPDEYAFWDIQHPTRRLSAIIAEAMFEGLQACGLRGHRQGNRLGDRPQAELGFVTSCGAGQ